MDAAAGNHFFKRSIRANAPRMPPMQEEKKEKKGEENSPASEAVKILGGSSTVAAVFYIAMQAGLIPSPQKQADLEVRLSKIENSITQTQASITQANAKLDELKNNYVGRYEQQLWIE